LLFKSTNIFAFSLFFPFFILSLREVIFSLSLSYDLGILLNQIEAK
jgi:hypothetical protein